MGIYINGVLQFSVPTPRLDLVYTSGVISATPNVLRNIWVEDHLMYLARETDNLLSIWDVYDPTAPVALGTVAVTAPLNVVKQGHYVYITTNQWLYIVDVANPTTPVVVGSINDGTNLLGAHGMDIEGKYAYIACYGGDRLTIVDISVPEVPVVVSSITDAALNGAHDVVVDYPFAYVSTEFGGAVSGGCINIINISQPRNPTIAATNNTAAITFTHIAKVGKYLFSGGLSSFDVGNTSVAPVLLDTVAAGGYWIVTLGSKYAIAVSGSTTMYLVDISDPADMVVLSSWTLAGIDNLRHIFVSGNYLFASVEITGVGGKFLVFRLSGIDIPTATLGNDAYPLTEVADAQVADPSSNLLAKLWRESDSLVIPTVDLWYGTNVGSGGSLVLPFYQYVYTGTTASSQGLLRTFVMGFGAIAGQANRVDWDKYQEQTYQIVRQNSDAQAIARVQLKETSAEGALAAKGFGIRVENLAIYGESYGVALGSVDLGVTMTDFTAYTINIRHYPGRKIEWWVNSVLKGTQWTAANIPSGYAGAASQYVHSIINGLAGGVDAFSYFIQPKMLKAR